MSYHPDNSMPGCMMPDGGDCCPAHAELVSEWNKLRDRNAKLAMLLKAQEETKDEIVRQANEAVHALTERNAKLVAALEAAKVYIAEDDDAESNRLLQQIRKALAQQSTEKP